MRLGKETPLVQSLLPLGYCKCLHEAAWWLRILHSLLSRPLDARILFSVVMDSEFRAATALVS